MCDLHANGLKLLMRKPLCFEANSCIRLEEFSKAKVVFWHLVVTWMYEDLILVFICGYLHNVVQVYVFISLISYSFGWYFPFSFFSPLQNNIAEVKELHSELMWKDFIDHISKLLHSVEVEVSYFAAGIIAHLISRGEQAWTLSRSQRTSLLEQLVQKWWWILSYSFIFFQCLYLTMSVLGSVSCSILPSWIGQPQNVRW